ncbi:hypothetical protein DPMN_115238 [Dreissena polymorpha]|uniref:Uncharacterized protein n=1 Tax=Dreissena polymorpha TaxID=45954 RepID=A0A9D4KLP4_DREPO|nr:hypothetical protein DPMN_115238 [Dreissena polymorpha]
MSMLKRLWSSTEKNEKRNKEDHVEEIKEVQPYNPFTELLFLEHHKDIVNLLIKIDSKRCVTAADDCLAIVWDIQFGYRLVTLCGHSRPITHMMQLPSHSHTHRLVTSSSDKQIRIWDLDTGDCLDVLTEHQTSVRCLLLLENTKSFCSGGENLCLWSNKGTLLTTWTGQAEEEKNINFMLQIKNARLITASEKNLAVFVIGADGALSLIKQLPPHREPVKSLINIQEDVFASASLDGTIKLWRTDSLLSHRSFNVVSEPEGPNKTFPYSVQCMMCLHERYLCAAIGTGFAIYDTDIGEEILHKTNAHHSKINHITFACDGLFLCTGAVDGSIRLWSCEDIIRDSLVGSRGEAAKILHQTGSNTSRHIL